MVGWGFGDIGAALRNRNGEEIEGKGEGGVQGIGIGILGDEMERDFPCEKGEFGDMERMVRWTLRGRRF